MPSRATALALVALLLAAGCLGDADPAESDDLGPEDEDLEARLTPEGLQASEVAIDADPTDPEHVVAAANSDGPDRDGFGVYVTRDAGATWEASFFEAREVREDPTQGPPFDAISDPVVAFAPNGTLYLAGLAFLPSSAVFVAASWDGDASFEHVVVVGESDVVARFNDKEWLGVNPETGTLVLAWQREPALDQLRSIEEAGGPDVDIGNVVVSRSTDGGRTFSDPVEVDRGMHNNGTQVAFTRGSTTHLIWVNYEANTIDHVRSTDDAETFSDPQPIADVDVVPPYDRYARMHTLPGLAGDPDGSTLVATWHDERAGDADVYAVASTDAGQSWDETVRVNPSNDGDGVIQFYPWVALGPDGRVHVSYYTSAPDPEHPRFTYVLATAPDAGLAFAEPRPAANATFTVFQSPNGTMTEEDPEGEHRGLGDYTGLTANEAGVFPAWADGRHDESVVYAARLPATGSGS